MTTQEKAENLRKEIASGGLIRLDVQVIVGDETLDFSFMHKVLLDESGAWLPINASMLGRNVQNGLESLLRVAP